MSDSTSRTSRKRPKERDGARAAAGRGDGDREEGRCVRRRPAARPLRAVTSKLNHPAFFLQPRRIKGRRGWEGRGKRHRRGLVRPAHRPHLSPHFPEELRSCSLSPRGSDRTPCPHVPAPPHPHARPGRGLTPPAGASTAASDATAAPLPQWPWGASPSPRSLRGSSPAAASEPGQVAPARKPSPSETHRRSAPWGSGGRPGPLPRPSRRPQLRR